MHQLVDDNPLHFLLITLTALTLRPDKTLLFLQWVVSREIMPQNRPTKEMLVKIIFQWSLINDKHKLIQQLEALEPELFLKFLKRFMDVKNTNFPDKTVYCYPIVYAYRENRQAFVELVMERDLDNILLVSDKMYKNQVEQSIAQFNSTWFDLLANDTRFERMIASIDAESNEALVIEVLKEIGTEHYVKAVDVLATLVRSAPNTLLTLKPLIAHYANLALTQDDAPLLDALFSLNEVFSSEIRAYFQADPERIAKLLNSVTDYNHIDVGWLILELGQNNSDGYHDDVIYDQLAVALRSINPWLFSILPHYKQGLDCAIV